MFHFHTIKSFFHKNVNPTPETTIVRRSAWLQSIVLFFVSVSFLTGCSTPNTPITKTGFYFDTVIQLTAYSEKDCDALESCFQLAQTYENMLSATKENSDIWNINHSHGTPTTVSPETIVLLKHALHYAELTDGMIDPTIYPVTSLWNFHSEETAQIPDTDTLASACSHVDYRQVIMDETNNTVTLIDPDSSVDLGFIAKGYIADCMKEFLISQHVTSANINLGGNVLVIGNKPDGTAYRIGIQEPFAKEGTPITAVPLSDQSLVSSGIYERYFYQDDVLYHHIINPHTGYPVENDLNGVTILSSSSMDGDAASTAAFCLGLDNGMKFIESRSDLEAIFITKDNTLHYSSGFPK